MEICTLEWHCCVGKVLQKLNQVHLFDCASVDANGL